MFVRQGHSVESSGWRRIDRGGSGVSFESDPRADWHRDGEAKEVGEFRGGRADRRTDGLHFEYVEGKFSQGTHTDGRSITHTEHNVH